MSYFHFSRTFKQSMGVSPNNYIVRVASSTPKTVVAIGFANRRHRAASRFCQPESFYNDVPPSDRLNSEKFQKNFVEKFMKNWDYKLMAGWLTETELNALGAEGWELVAVIITPTDKNYDYIFKRPKP